MVVENRPKEVGLCMSEDMKTWIPLVMLIRSLSLDIISSTGPSTTLWDFFLKRLSQT